MESIRGLISKKAFGNGIWMFSLQIFNSVIPLLTLPYITRILGKEQYGLFSIAFNIISYLQVVVEFGYGMSATRKVAIKGKTELNNVFSAVLISRLFFLSLSVIFGLIYIYLNRLNSELCYSFLALMICLVGYCIQLNWLFQGMQDMKYISIVNIFARTISVVLIFTLVKTKNDLILYSVLYSISPLLSGIIGICIAKRKYKIRFQWLSWRRIKQEIRDGFFVFTTQMSSKVFSAIGVTFLGIFSLASEVGAFSAIQKITHIMMLCWTPIGQVLYPISSQHMSNDFEEGKRYVYRLRRVIMPFFILLAVVIGIFAKMIVSILYGNEFIEYYYWLYPLLGWLLLSINNNFLGIQILLASGNDARYSKCFQISVICTIAINLIFVYFWGGIGAAIAPMLSEIILLVLLTKESCKD